jgi:hypothetical protein
MVSDEVRRVIKILSDVEDNLESAKRYVRRARRENDSAQGLRRAEREITSAISEIDTAKSKLKNLG